QNAWARDYGKRRGTQDSHDRLNQRDSDEWLRRAKQLLASQDFTALSAHAGNPQACSTDQMNEIATLTARLALERTLACLKALKASNPQALDAFLCALSGANCLPYPFGRSRHLDGLDAERAQRVEYR